MAFPIDVSESADEFVVEADLPGRRKQDVDVTVRGRRVTIAADPPDEARTGETGGDRAGEYSHRGRRRQRRRAVRTVELPERVSEKRSWASFGNGVLEIRLPKADDGTRVEVA